MVFAPSLADAYGSDSFPSLTDSIYNYKRDTHGSSELVEHIKLELSVVTYAIYSAGSILRESFDFERYIR